MTTDELISVAILVVIFLGIAFPVHEFAHAFVAYRLGDGTAKLFGRLTLNPVVHFDPMGGLLLVISALGSGLTGTGFIFGWAKPTPVNPSNLRDRRNGEVLVAIAGPVSNLLMAVLGAVVWRVVAGFNVDLPGFFWQILFSFVAFNIALAIFNLIPVPPLDGSALLFRLVSPQTAWQLRPMLAQYGLIIVIVFVLFGGAILGRLIGGVTELLLGL
ncbi:MAG: site-2 protease family protein [Chloroflexota bacterium]|nr:site-2 protease family protein [Chloroflexota bacterium]